MAAVTQFGPKFEADDPSYFVKDLGAMSPKLTHYVLNDVNGTGAKFAAGGYFTGWNNEVLGFIPEYTFGTNTNRTFLDILKTLPGDSPVTPTGSTAKIAWSALTYIPSAVAGFKGTLTASIRASIGGSGTPAVTAVYPPTATNGDDLVAGDWTFGRVNH